MLLNQTVSLLNDSFAGVFAQKRTRERAVELSMGTLCSFGRRTISRSICAVGRQQKDWSADYKLFSRSPWHEDQLFDPVIRDYLARYPDGPIRMAVDDTTLARGGRHIATAFWQRDALSPPFHVNLIYGLRFMQASLLYPHYQQGDYSARSMPIRFVESPAVKKPGKRASEQEKRLYREVKKKQNLSFQGLEVIKSARKSFDIYGAAGRDVLAAVDGSLCNKTTFKNELDRVHLVGRCRKDARLCFPALPGSRRKYNKETFTPEQTRKDEQIEWHQENIYFGGQWRTIRYKQLDGVLWRRGAGVRKLRLIVIAPVPYKLSPNARRNYREPAYLLSTDCDSEAGILIQCYFDRWQIEVNHREEKSTLGVGEAQVWSEKSVPRQPAFAVACYSLLLLSALKAFGPGRGSDFVVLPKWRRKAKRPSALDLITLLRKEINETSVSDCLAHRLSQNIVPYAYT